MAHTLSTNPNIQALEWISKVSAADRGAFEEAVQSDGYPGYLIVERGESGVLGPAAARREHYPVYFTEPLRGNGDGMGFDQASDPARLEALAKARDTGDAAG